MSICSALRITVRSSLPPGPMKGSCSGLPLILYQYTALSTILATIRSLSFVVSQEDVAIITLLTRHDTAFLLRKALDDSSQEEIFDPMCRGLHDLQQEIPDSLRETRSANFLSKSPS